MNDKNTNIKIVEKINNMVITKAAIRAIVFSKPCFL